MERPKSRGLDRLQVVIDILKRKGKVRTDKEIDLLVPLVQNIKFIQEIFKDRDSKQHSLREIVSCFTHEEHLKDSNVFEYGK